MDIRAVSFDLDDTLWPVLPAILEAERCVDRWLRTHHPDVARTWSVQALRDLRDQIADEHTHLGHDLGALRRLTMERAFAACGVTNPPVDEVWNIFYAARNNVELFPDTLTALERIRAHVPVATLTNGNADLTVIGLHHLFHQHVSAALVGVAKPDRRIFELVSDRLGVPAAHVLHVGDDPTMDVRGAKEAGMRTVWFNREGGPWPLPDEFRADLEFTNLSSLASWLDDHFDQAQPAA
ncbi:MAG TPA: HAD family hydrolase [Pinirhizobacter sp.]|uniref:HAD family hydrolase n=1 Tax=Pinirhizobacter sp. TaxID=2950432 RepID=UPI002BF82EA1|nr:HAD family hydrolase [Pinirhizobacter sp.]HMH69093.1 HAD family hydrolase [Pinirhizobacter sp.]